MDNAELLVVAMAQKCKGLIQEWETPDIDLPKALQPKHLLWMCNKIDEHAEDGPATQIAPLDWIYSRCDDGTSNARS